MSGIISVTGLQARDPRVSSFIVELYADAALTNLLYVHSAPAIFDASTGIANMVGAMNFTGLTVGTTYYLQSCTIIPGVGRGDFSAVYSQAAGADTAASSDTTFGSGPPSGSANDGDVYFDTSTTPYTMYVYHSGAWHIGGSTSGGLTGIFSSGSNANGYWVQDPAGNLRQWGVVTTDINSGTLSVTFPVNFSSSVGVSVVVTTKSSTDRITYVVDGSVTASGFTIGNNGSGGYAYWEANGPGVASGGGGGLGPVVGFIMNDGSTGTNVGPMLAAARTGQFTKCVIVTKASDGSTGLQIRIKKNGTDVFSSDPTVAAGTSAGTVTTSTALTSNPLSVTAGDVFSIDILGGSSAWKFTAQLE